MKKIVFFILGSCLALFFGNAMASSAWADDGVDKNTVQIYCTPELDALSSAWINQFGVENKGVEIRKEALDNPLTRITEDKNSSLVLLTQAMMTQGDETPALQLIVGRNVLVPVISQNNPFIDQLNQTGIVPDELAKVLSLPQTSAWNDLLPASGDRSLPIYVTSTAVKTSTYQTLVSENPDAASIGIVDGESIGVFMKKNPEAIVFCRLSEIIDEERYSFIDGIQVIPFDRNANRQIDYMENIYSSLSDFSRAVWIGKYPKLFCECIYLVSNDLPEKESELAFVEWILTKGQDQLNKGGYAALTGSEVQAGLALLNPIDAMEVAASTASGRSVWPFILGALGIILVLGMVVNYAFQQKSRSKISRAEGQPFFSRNISSGFISIPQGVWYDKTHTWLFREKNGEVRIGLDDFFQHLTGPITRIELKKTGENIRKGEALLSVARDGKRLTIYSPISGTVAASNTSLFDNPAAINSDPFSEGWVYLVEPVNWKREMQFLKLAENYREWIKTEFVRLKDFLAATLKPNQFEGVVALQDGGIVKDGLLAEMDPQVWEEFQTNFINTSK